ncbi:MAG TPA: hypothetical protein ENJ12_07190 [Thiolapillus brandeum]|uniref:Sulfotransferase family protein n=1 Tax=Thiolapillus brandeum TaxID=1076588 RepID=A0A831W8A5_9GAMM|nr:hypothetical protein [Thiolapillus brandeum]
MSIAAKAGKLSRITSIPRALLSGTKYLFILSHMRSRSSVLSHVLGSNPGICGYRELQFSYRGRISLMKMQIRLLFSDPVCEPGDQYLLDKILHNYYLFSDRAFELARPKVIFLLRKPEHTIKSIIKMGHITGIDWYKDPVEATEYYCSRLSGLEEYARKFGTGNLFIDSEDLVDNTDHTLHRLTKWLNLEVPLDNRYSIFPDTGRPGYGDPSNNIRSGMIRNFEGSDNITLPPETLDRATGSYEKCRNLLLRKVTC